MATSKDRALIYQKIQQEDKTKIKTKTEKVNTH